MTVSRSQQYFPFQEKRKNLTGKIKLLWEWSDSKADKSFACLLLIVIWSPATQMVAQHWVIPECRANSNFWAHGCASSLNHFSPQNTIFQQDILSLDVKKVLLFLNKFIEIETWSSLGCYHREQGEGARLGKQWKKSGSGRRYGARMFYLWDPTNKSFESPWCLK